MKIQTITRRLLQHQRHLLTVCVATMFVAAGGNASAQSGGLLQYLAGPSASASTVQGPQSKTNGTTQRTKSRSAQSQANTISQDGQNFRVMSAASANVRTAADINRPSSVQRAGSVSSTNLRGTIGSAVHHQPPVNQSPVQQVSCTSCDSNQCGGSCSGYRAGSMGSYVSGGGWGCGSCEPYKFSRIDVLFMERSGDSRFTLAQDFGMDGFDFEWGTRVTTGFVPDCVHGCEFTFISPMDWDMSASLTDPAAGLNTLLVTRPPAAVGDLSAFNNATGQQQTYTADYWSLEANKTLIGWDVAKLLFGARYIDYDEDYGYTSRNNVGQTGAIRSTTDNQLFGAQIGMELLYPVAQHLYTDFRARAGAYLNFADSDMLVVNNGTTVTQNGADDVELAGVFEVGTGLRFNLGEALSIRGGTELWYLSGLATAPDQFGSVVTPQLGRDIRMDDDVLFVGFSFGAELRY